MDQSCEANAHPKLFKLNDREQTGLSRKTGALLATEVLLRAAGHFPGSKRPKRWRETVDGFGRRTEDRKYTLSVFKKGDYWFVVRGTSRSKLDFEYLALAFNKLPLCTRSDQEAMRLADHCHPEPEKIIYGLCWVSWLEEHNITLRSSNRSRGR
jgi:hypothetical protein